MNNTVKVRKRRGVLVMAMIVMAFLVMTFCVPWTSVKAADGEGGGYESWVRNKDSGYTHAPGGTVKPLPSGAVAHGVAGGVPSAKDDTNDSFETRFSTWLVKLGSQISEEMKDGSIDASATGVVMAHLTTGNSFFVFDLTDTNIYGIIGATIYAALRTLVLAFLFIYVLIRLIITLYEGDIHGLASLKEVLYSALLTMILLFIMPQIVDWVCTARDAVATSLYTKILAISGGEGDAQAKMLNVQGLELVYYNMWAANRSTGNAIIYLMVTVIVPLVYIVSYFKIAIQQTMLFGMYPAFALLGFGDSSLNGKWAVHFFSNAFVPTLDMVLMFIPALVSMAMAEAGMEDGFLKALIIMACFVSIVPVRNQILSMLGNSFGVSPSIGGALALGAAAIGGLVAMGKGAASLGSTIASNGGGGSDSSVQTKESDRSMEEMSRKADAPVEGSARQKEAEQADKGIGPDGHVKDIPNRSDEQSSTAEAQSIMNGDNDSSNSETKEVLSREEENAAQAAAMVNDKLDLGDGVQSEKELAVQSEKELAGADSGSRGAAITPDEVAPNEGVYEAPAGVGEGSYPPEANPMQADVDRSIYNDVPGGEVTKDDIQKRAMEKEAEASSAKSSGTEGSSSGKMNGKTGTEEELSRAAAVTKASNRMDKLSNSGSKYTDFNQRRLANLENMGAMQKQSATYERTIATSTATITNSNNAIQMNDRKIARLTAADPNKNAAEISRLQTENERHENAIKTASQTIQDTTVAKSKIDAGIVSSRAREEQFAKAFATTGMSVGTTAYSNADDFAKDLQHSQRKAEIASLKNYSGADVKGFLTPEQRKQYERKEAMTSVGSEIGRIAGMAAGMGAMGLAYGVMSVGGEDAQRQILSLHEKKMSRGFSEVGDAVGTGVARAGGAIGAGVGKVASHLPQYNGYVMSGDGYEAESVAASFDSYAKK